jgi:altronate dehydratase small subunit
MLKFGIAAHEKDNVATIVKTMEKGEQVIAEIAGQDCVVTLVDSIDYGHKYALKDIAEREFIIKYGEVIGRATKAIAAGEHVHVHNVASERGRGDLEGEN